MFLNSLYRVLIVAGISLGAAMPVGILIASCSNPQCIAVDCKNTDVGGGAHECTQYDYTHASNLYAQTGGGLLANVTENPLYFKTRMRGTCPVECSPQMYPGKASCSGAQPVQHA